MHQANLNKGVKIPSVICLIYLVCSLPITTWQEKISKGRAPNPIPWVPHPPSVPGAAKTERAFLV